MTSHITCITITSTSVMCVVNPAEVLRGTLQMSSSHHLPLNIQDHIGPHGVQLTTSAPVLELGLVSPVTEPKPDRSPVRSVISGGHWWSVNPVTGHRGHWSGDHRTPRSLVRGSPDTTVTGQGIWTIVTEVPCKLHYDWLSVLGVSPLTSEECGPVMRPWSGVSRFSP